MNWPTTGELVLIFGLAFVGFVSMCVGAAYGITWLVHHVQVLP